MKWIAIAALAASLLLSAAASHAKPHKETTRSDIPANPFCENDARCAPQARLESRANFSRHVRGGKKLRVPLPPRPHDASGNVVLVTVPTAAGKAITVASSIAPQMQGFIADLVAAGYTPKRISCYSRSKTHVPGSLHFRGLACDFDQHIVEGCDRTPRRFCATTAPKMHNVAALTSKWHLRNGCSFGDCGHIDSGSADARKPWPRTLTTSAQAEASP